MKRRTLILGEGDFSFANALAKRRKASQVAEDQDEIVATCFDGKDELLAKYPHCEQSLPRIRQAGIEVEFGVDAMSVPDRLRNFDGVVFNHPHIGIEDAKRHKVFLVHFLHNAKALLAEHGEVHLTLKADQGHRWELSRACERAGLYLARVEDFKWSEYPGYELRRHQSGKAFSHIRDTQRAGNEKAWVSSKLFVLSLDPPKSRVEVPKAELSNAEEEKKAPPKLPFSCPRCKRGFKEERSLKAHLKNHPEEPKHPCPDCSRRFGTEAALEEHRQAAHLREKLESRTPGDWDRGDYLCALCGFRSESEDAHLALLRPDPPVDLPCPTCGKVFGERRALQQHVLTCKPV